MKTLKLMFVIMVLSVGLANATTWYQGGVLYGNVCRSGAYYTVYPIAMGQPVGTACPVRDGYGNVIGTGVVTAE